MHAHPTAGSPAPWLPRLAPGDNPLWGPDWPEVRALWPLDSSVAHVNHGAYGGVPLPVLDEQRSWRERMEENPSRFFLRDLPGALAEARFEVACFLGSDPDGTVFVANATTGVSTVLAGFPLAADDEVLVTDHGYGAVAIAAERYAGRSGARVVTVGVELDADPAAVTAAVLAGVTTHTRLAILDQVTSPTARRLPLDRLVPALHERGAAVLIDAAHAPGMLPVDVTSVGAEFWTGNLHKWCCAPRGTGVLYARPDWRQRLRPLVASWNEPAGWPAAFDYTGTADVTAWLAAPRALRLLGQLGWDRLRAHNLHLVETAAHRLGSSLGLDPDTLPRDPAVSMRLVPLPAGVGADEAAAMGLRRRVAEVLGTEVAVTTWRGRGFVRLSAHAYNGPGDYDRLVEGLPSLL